MTNKESASTAERSRKRAGKFAALLACCLPTADGIQRKDMDKGTDDDSKEG